MSAAAAIALAGLVLAACDSGDSSESTAGDGAPVSDGGGTLTVAIGQDLETLDIRGLGSAASFSLLRHITEPLVAFDPEGELIPALAESWDQVDPTTLRLNLRKGVKFTNGDPMDAKAVKYSIEKVLDPEFGAWNRSYVEGLIDEIKIVDDHTIEIVEPKPTTRLLNGLTTLDIVDPKYDKGDKMKTDPIGTGPYKFVSFKPRQEVVLERNPDYWGTKAPIEKIVWRIIPDPSTQVAALQSGEVQMIGNMPFASLDSVKGGSNTDVLEGDTARLIFLAMDNTKGPLSDPKVRQAINHAVDKDAVVKSVLRDQAQVAVGPCAPLTAFCLTDPTYEYDVGKAKALLREAGYNGEPIEFTVGKGRYPNDDVVGQAVAAQLKKAGLNVELKTIDYSSLSSELSAAEGKSPYDMWLQGWSADSNDLIGMLQSLFGGDLAVYPMGYDNRDVNALLKDASETIEEGKLEDDLTRAQDQIMRDAPAAPVYVPNQILGVSKSLEGFQPRFDEYFFFWDAKLS